MRIRGKVLLFPSSADSLMACKSGPSRDTYPLSRDTYSMSRDTYALVPSTFYFFYFSRQRQKILPFNTPNKANSALRITY